MRLSKSVTLTKTVCSVLIYCFKVTQVTVKVTVKSIDIDIIYNIVTLVTCKLRLSHEKIKNFLSHVVCNFSGNQVTFDTNQYVAVKNSVTLTVTWLPLEPVSYLRTAVTFRGI